MLSITLSKCFVLKMLSAYYICCIYLTLKGPRKNASETLRLLKSSAANNCLSLLTNSSIEADRMDPDQTAPIGAV